MIFQPRRDSENQLDNLLVLDNDDDWRHHDYVTAADQPVPCGCAAIDTVICKGKANPKAGDRVDDDSRRLA